MTGIISQMRGGGAPDGAQAAPDDQAPAAAEVPSRGNEQSAQATPDDAATPEEQKAYDKLVTGAMSVMHGQAKQQIVAALNKGMQHPAEALAGAASNLTIQIADKIKAPDEAILPAAGEILGLVAELADATGTFTANRREVERAMVLLVQTLATHYGVSAPEMSDFMQTVGKQHAQEIAQGLHSVSASVAAGAPQGAPGTVPQNAQAPSPAAPQASTVPEQQGVA